jgi:hypothetical protein
MTRWVGHVASTGEVRNVYKTLFREPEGKKTLGRPRCSWEDILNSQGVRVWTGLMWFRIIDQ